MSYYLAQIQDYLLGSSEEIIVPAIVIDVEKEREEWKYWLNKIEQHYDEISNIPNHLKNKYFYYEAANVNGLILKHMPPEYHTAEFYEICVKNNSRAIMHAKKDVLTYKVCFLAVAKNAAMFSYIPEEFTSGTI